MLILWSQTLNDPSIFALNMKTSIEFLIGLWLSESNSIMKSDIITLPELELNRLDQISTPKNKWCYVSYDTDDILFHLIPYQFSGVGTLLSFSNWAAAVFCRSTRTCLSLITLLCSLIYPLILELNGRRAK